MRKEAALEQWGALYEAAARIKDLKPWEKFWDMDMIGVQNGEEEDTVFFSVLGKGGECYGIAVYEGYEGLNTYMMLAMQKNLNLSPEYAMFNQKNLTCYWGNRDELTNKQRAVIKDLGYKYRGKNQWLYFISYEPGYWPFNMDEEEVVRMTEHMRDLEKALQCYDESGADVDFESGNMFLLTFGKDKKTWDCGEVPLPLTCFQCGHLIINDEELLSDLAKMPGCSAVLEAGVLPMGASIADKKYDRPSNPMLALLGDAESEIMLKFEMTEPEDDAVALLAEIIIAFILEYGSPKEIRVSNVIVESGLRQICDVCKIKLRRVKQLGGLETFVQEMKRFRD